MFLWVEARTSDVWSLPLSQTHSLNLKYKHMYILFSTRILCQFLGWPWQNRYALRMFKSTCLATTTANKCYTLIIVNSSSGKALSSLGQPYSCVQSHKIKILTFNISKNRSYHKRSLYFNNNFNAIKMGHPATSWSSNWLTAQRDAFHQNGFPMTFTENDQLLKKGCYDIHVF